MKKNAVVLSLAVTALLAGFGMGNAIAQDAEHDHQHQAASAGSPEKKAKSAKSKSAAKPNKAAAAYLADFVEKAKKSGLVASLIEKHQVKGLSVAPPAGA